jgi:hypothetical protein
LGATTVTITDHASQLFTANVDWTEIMQQGTGGNLNLNGIINLTSISYSGTEADLLALKAIGSGVDAVTFTFTPAKLLSTLAGAGGSTSFSGSIYAASAVPEPTTVVAGLLLLLPFGAGAMRVLRKNK